MEERILRSMAVKSIAIMVSVILISVGITNYSNVMIFANESENEIDPAAYAQVSKKVYLDGLDRQLREMEKQKAQLLNGKEDVKAYLGNRYLVIEKGTDQSADAALEDLYISKSIRLTIGDLEEKNISYQSVKRVCDEEELYGVPIMGNQTDTVKSIDISYLYNEGDFTYTAIVELALDHIYSYHIYEDAKNIYVDLRNPHDEYEKIIVIDAGHGGRDIGTYSPGMEYFEKDINLSILLYLREFLEQENIKVYYTRTEDDRVYLNPRLNLANELNADMFISIHCNGTEDGQSYGIEVLYDETAPVDGMCSKRLAEICLDHLEQATGLRNRGIKERSDVYIIGNAKVPVALLEVGFITNQTDLDYLSKEKNRKKIAEAIYHAIMEAYKEMEDV